MAKSKTTGLTRAKRLGLSHIGFGRFGKNGKATHKLVNGQLLKLSKNQTNSPKNNVHVRKKAILRAQQQKVKALESLMLVQKSIKKHLAKKPRKPERIKEWHAMTARYKARFKRYKANVALIEARLKKLTNTGSMQ